MELAVQFDNASTAKNDLRKAYEKCNDIPQENRALIDTFLKQESDKDYKMHLAMYSSGNVSGSIVRNSNSLNSVIANSFCFFASYADVHACNLCLKSSDTESDIDPDALPPLLRIISVWSFLRVEFAGGTRSHIRLENFGVILRVKGFRRIPFETDVDLCSMYCKAELLENLYTCFSEIMQKSLPVMLMLPRLLSTPQLYLTASNQNELKGLELQSNRLEEL
ncbi:hypothetical protein Tco_0148824 [Tanacetum coccineum]